MPAHFDPFGRKCGQIRQSNTGCTKKTTCKCTISKKTGCITKLLNGVPVCVWLACKGSFLQESLAPEDSVVRRIWETCAITFNDQMSHLNFGHAYTHVLVTFVTDHHGRGIFWWFFCPCQCTWLALSMSKNKTSVIWFSYGGYKSNNSRNECPYSDQMRLYSSHTKRQTPNDRPDDTRSTPG